MSQICNHESCIKSSLLGLRQGIYYGGKIRFFHALVMTFLFRPGSIKSKFITVIQLTYQHAKNLGTFVFLYKSIVCILNNIRKKQTKLHNLISGAICGYLVFGRNKSAVNQQIVLYVMSRVIIGLASNIQRRKLLPSSWDAFPLQAAVVWGLVMLLFEDDKGCLQNSLTSSMTFLYKDSDRSYSSWAELIPFEMPDFLSFLWK
ncbi:unnamed protein product (macronuclear) [Paramecium tetraurelia]|uniref:Peroxisomal membrane protein 4 n=2 Tax=Paramecium TaxID=5884 RepID=A0BTG7_PARTE|nr:uncharacterized protein GSPATT00032066001 [Paramecium tetraurelia]CAD8196299.1 unnamed protein product [Paramecium octaurelia]CAK61834.1 unnamed protein product [Paramecium tetraurelia]|eukprot:XP_001429232.1 hypothetical protein (macronuclear) [Paramecium tetraurelia strain d4-2]